MSLHSSVILSGIHRVIKSVAVHLAEGVIALLLTSVSEEDGWERGVVGLVDDPEPDVVTPINRVVLLADKMSFMLFFFNFFLWDKWSEDQISSFANFTLIFTLVKLC